MRVETGSQLACSLIKNQDSTGDRGGSKVFAVVRGGRFDEPGIGVVKRVTKSGNDLGTGSQG